MKEPAMVGPDVQSGACSTFWPDMGPQGDFDEHRCRLGLYLGHRGVTICQGLAAT